ncbi:MAG: hypothetical protein COW01_09455 [Bdellovibrionales bacterium CG12_big_fil_rev_8_21_14_0_65_38_15]|nr:MAG: hypothetical protein COW79_09460 [Bdellovibrionales bacterium CG22_combo_CG10-13_8_21_14_all_38_13]PIQ54753.1 MAG: hypothetical protein COW01_09455 [Bdellovibrionales bacterium CG12_big_fil_rev_8_21_14_0_65_38_15]PIR31308.1 MAG: hypothetical protein COV38_01070 [Bdellovibrionales bacterium CG11_big_fil_rev_8_21_14_0_20_38_13]
MNIEQNYSISLRNDLPPAIPRKSCAFCGSVFVTNQECESCGRQFNKETLGAPGGEKSFYATKERYKKDVGSFLLRFDEFLAKDSSYRTRYLSLLKKRYMTLLDHFQRPGRTAVDCHAYLVEFRDLVAEMQRMKISSDYMYDLVDLDETGPLTHKLRTILNEEYSSHSSNALRSFWRYRVAEGPRLGFILSLVLGYGGLCLCAIYLFSYLAKR